jgi:hypothetical protein
MNRRNEPGVDRVLYITEPRPTVLECVLVLETKAGGEHPRFVCGGKHAVWDIVRLSAYLEAPIVMNTSVTPAIQEKLRWHLGTVRTELPQGMEP